MLLLNDDSHTPDVLVEPLTLSERFYQEKDDVSFDDLAQPIAKTM
jgi:hypothetical protein